jgi:hypothetical protein
MSVCTEWTMAEEERQGLSLSLVSGLPMLRLSNLIIIDS